MLLTDSWRPPPAPTRHPVTRTCPPCRGLGSLPRPLIQELAGASADVLCGQSPWMPQLAPPHLTRGFITSSDSQVAEEKKRQPPPPPTQPSPSDTRLLAPSPAFSPSSTKATARWAEGAGSRVCGSLSIPFPLTLSHTPVPVGYQPSGQALPPPVAVGISTRVQPPPGGGCPTAGSQHAASPDRGQAQTGPPTRCHRKEL